VEYFGDPFYQERKQPIERLDIVCIKLPEQGFLLIAILLQFFLIQFSEYVDEPVFIGSAVDLFSKLVFREIVSVFFAELF
jgi:hypothetical protein